MNVRYGDKTTAMPWIIFLSIFFWTAGPATAQKGGLSEEFRTFDIASTIVSVIRNSEDGLRQHGYGESLAKSKRLQFAAFKKFFDLELDLNANLVPDGFKVSVIDRNKITTFSPKTENCHYRGKLKGSVSSVAAIGMCSDGIRGYIQDGTKEVYYLEPAGNGSNKIVVVRDSDKISEAKNCGVDLDSSLKHSTNTTLVSTLHTVKTKRSIKLPSKSNAESLFVELVLVADTKVYERYQKNETRITNRFIEIVSVVNALYAPLNIFVALTGVEIWSSVDKISITNDSEVTLKNFLRYRRKELAFRLPSDNAYLITFATFDGMVVGKALKGQMCTYEYSGGVAKDHSRMAGPVGATVAHEMGHNFGMEHDFTDCQCLDDRCIMTPASVGQTPSNWSSCSRKYLEDNLARGIGSCLKRVPMKVEGPYCGNGFLEDGEECDCGPEEFCHNKCCIATACKLSVNATCGHGSCCDLDTCSIKKAATICRERPSDECDLPEYCDGKAGTCPDDFWKDDGTKCRDGQAYCSNGACRTHKDQCEYLWGSTGNVADDKCFELNVKGNANGNCGRDRVNESYFMCAVRDTKCGLLHCTSQVERLAIGAESATSVSQSFIPARTTYISCRAAYVDFGLQVMDPGMVPNGAKCGEEMMCYNQVCTHISNVPRKCGGSCGNHGVCNNMGHCHCDEGYAPPDCSSSGYGGSVDSGAANSSDSYRRLRDAMLVIFLLVIPLIVAVLCLYFLRHRIKDWLLKKKKHSRPRNTQTSKPAVVKNVQKISGLPKSAKRQKSIRGVPISHPVALKSSNDTVVAMNIGNGKLTNTYLNEVWPIEQHNGPIYVNELAAVPPPLPAKPPKAVRDPPQVLHQLAIKHSEPPVPIRGVDIEEITLRPIRPAPAPPPRPPVSQPVSRNSSGAGSVSRRRTRPSNRPPDPPSKAQVAQTVPSQSPSEDDSSSDSSLMGKVRENTGDNIPKNSLVSELARKFESRRRGGQIQ